MRSSWNGLRFLKRTLVHHHHIKQEAHSSFHPWIVTNIPVVAPFRRDHSSETAKKPVRVRYAPSPTGPLHLGGLRTCLYNYLFARQNKGTMILRIEDTDRTRFVENSVEDMQEMLKWSGIEIDEGPTFQSSRLPIYSEHAFQLLEKGHAYRCFCTEEDLANMRGINRQKVENPIYDRRCFYLSEQQIDEKLRKNIPYTIRLNIPQGEKTEFKDLVRGRVSIDHKIIDDQILLKSDGWPTYHLASVVDDHYMNISHVIRGEEWISSVPKHVVLYKSFGWEPPQFCHLPLLLNPDHSKLSKRKTDTSVRSYKDAGFEPEALINFVAFLGWTPDESIGEILSMNQLIDNFNITKIHKGGAVVNRDKLIWFNSQHLRVADVKKLIPKCKEVLSNKLGKEKMEQFDENYVTSVVDVARTRMQYLADIEKQKYYFIDPELSKQDIEALLTEENVRIAKILAEEFQSLKESEYNKENISNLFKRLTADTDKKIASKHLFSLLRIALSGEKVGAELPSMITVLGKDAVLKRLKFVLSHKT